MPRAPKAKSTAVSSNSEEDTKTYNRTPSAPPASPSKKDTAAPSPSKKAKSWTKADKIKLLLEVIGSQKADFDLIKDKFEGRSKTQVYDQWRQQVLPALKSHGTVEGGKPAAE